MARNTSARADALRSRYQVPRDAPRYRELAAALAVAALVAHLLLAQLTLLLAAAMYAIGRASRWRPQWLAAPAGAGLLWTLAIGLPRAASGLAAGPRHVLGYLGGIGEHPGHLLTLQDTFSGLGHWLPEQFPLALILASGEALVLGWLQRRVSGGPQWRTGLIVATRRWLTAAWLRRGGVVTRDGAILGVDMATGRPASISWREAEGGVLCASPAGGGQADLPGGRAGAWHGGRTDGVPGGRAGPGSGTTQDGFAIVLAAIRRRKPVVVIDVTGSRLLAAALAAACQEPGAPLAVFGPDGPGCYEPLRGGDPARAARMITAMVDWSAVSDQHRRSCAAYLADALAVQAAAPAGRGVAVLEDLMPLLTPRGLRERAARIPAHHPRSDVLTDRAAVSASLLQADPAITAAIAEQLGRLRASGLGSWLRPPSPDGGPDTRGPTNTVRISLGQTVRERAVTLFCLDRAAQPDAARMITAMAAADLITVAAELAEMSVSGDMLAWINGCEVLGQQAVPELISQLIASGSAAGMSVLLSTTSPTAAEMLATSVSVLAADRPVDPALMSRFAGVTAPRTARREVSPGSDGAVAAVTGPQGATAVDGGPAFAINGPASPGAAALGGRLALDLGAPAGAFGLDAGAHGSTFALLARGNHGARPRVLAHCRSVPLSEPAELRG